MCVYDEHTLKVYFILQSICTDKNSVYRTITALAFRSLHDEQRLTLCSSVNTPSCL